jgi:catechol 2,3-dioxygenase-like lactoylglutathione lyase family enzyme
MTIKIKVASVFVNDQDKALRFYTEVMGFKKKTDAPAGEGRWLTVVAPDEPDGAELLLEPNSNPAAQTYQKAIYEQGIPATALMVDDLDKEYERLTKLGVKFTVEPTKAEWGAFAVLDDGCGNLICLSQA